MESERGFERSQSQMFTDNAFPETELALIVLGMLTYKREITRGKVRFCSFSRHARDSKGIVPPAYLMASVFAVSLTERETQP